METTRALLFAFAVIGAAVGKKEIDSSIVVKRTDKRGLEDSTNHGGAVSYSHLVQNHRQADHHNYIHNTPIVNKGFVPLTKLGTAALQGYFPQTFHNGGSFQRPLAVQYHQPVQYAPVPLFVERPVHLPVRIPVREPSHEFEALYVAKLAPNYHQPQHHYFDHATFPIRH